MLKKTISVYFKNDNAPWFMHRSCRVQKSPKNYPPQPGPPRFPPLSKALYMKNRKSFSLFRPFFAKITVGEAAKFRQKPEKRPKS